MVVKETLSKCQFLWMPDGPVPQEPVGGPPGLHDGAGIQFLVVLSPLWYKEHPHIVRCSGGIFCKVRTFGRHVGPISK